MSEFVLLGMASVFTRSWPNSEVLKVSHDCADGVEAHMRPDIRVMENFIG